MRNSTIILNPEPKGVFKEGQLAVAAYPGTFVTLKRSVTTLVGGRHTWEPFQTTQGADGDLNLTCVLYEDWGQGAMYNTQYAANSRFRGYCPLPGEELNCLLKDIAGTGDVHNFGEILEIDAVSGKLIVSTNAATLAKFQLLEQVGAISTDTWVWVQYLG